MAYTLGNNCAKNLCKRTVLLKLIIENVVTCFLEHSVESVTDCSSLLQGQTYTIRYDSVYLTRAVKS